MRPVQDPNNPEYMADPDRRWFGGQWRTQRQIEMRRELDARDKRERYHTDPEYRDRQLEYAKELYWGLSGVEYAHLLLRKRRQKALRRMAERNGR